MRTSVKIFAWLTIALLTVLMGVVTRWAVRPNDSGSRRVADIAEGSVPDPDSSRQPILRPTLVSETTPTSQRNTVNDSNLIQVSVKVLETSAAVLPLVFRNVTNALELSEQQLQTFAELQQKFVEDLGGLDQDPSDPDYRQRWQVEQQTSDDLLLALLGGEFYVSYELATFRSSSPR